MSLFQVFYPVWTPDLSSNTLDVYETWKHTCNTREIEWV
jgi:hypothetical protein